MVSIFGKLVRPISRSLMAEAQVDKCSGDSEMGECVRRQVRVVVHEEKETGEKMEGIWWWRQLEGSSLVQTKEKSAVVYVQQEKNDCVGIPVWRQMLLDKSEGEIEWREKKTQSTSIEKGW